MVGVWGDLTNISYPKIWSTFWNTNKKLKWNKTSRQIFVSWPLLMFSKSASKLSSAHCRFYSADMINVESYIGIHFFCSNQPAKCITLWMYNKIKSILKSCKKLFCTYFQGMGCDRFLCRTHAPRTSRNQCARTRVRTLILWWSHFAPAPAPALFPQYEF